MLLQRAQAVQPELLLTAHNALSLTEICRLLEGIPLALELAAPRLKLLSPQALLVRLEGRLQVLTGGARDLPERQRTMRAALAWSYELLTPVEQALFRRLAVFVGGWTLSAAEAVCQAAGALTLDVLEGLASLLDKSLIRVEQTGEGETRFRMLYVLREFALEQLAATGDLIATREAHAASFLALAEQAQLRGGQQKMWRARLEQEYDNLRSALTWWLERAQQPDGQQAAEYALRLCNGLFLFWGSSGLLQEGRDFMERALRVRMGVDETVQAKALARAAEVLTTLGTPEPGEALAQESLALARKVGNPDEIARALRILGEGAALREAYEQARLYFEEAAALEQQTGNVWMRVINLFSLATIARRQGHYERAYALLEECVALGQTLGDPWQLGWMLTQLGWTHLVAQGDLSRAASLAEQGLALVRGVGNRLYYARVLGMLGEIRRQQGKLDEARMLLEEGLAFFKEKALQNGVFEFQMSLARLLAQQGQVMEAQALYYENRALLPAAGQKLLIAEYLEGWGVVLATLGAPERAARLWGAAEVLREAIDSPMFPIYREEYAQAVTTARTRLRNDAFVAAWNEGRAMTPAQALDAAADQEMLAHPREGIPRKTPVSPGGPEGLTPREVEVLRLLAQGLTNAHIAERLVVSPLTVHTHLGSIYSKLGVTSRSGATRYALDHHLL